MAKTWYDKGIRFECQGSGNCCTSRGEYGFVYLTKQDLKRFAKYFDLSVADFKKQYCDQTGDVWHLKESMSKNPAPKENLDCIFLKEKKCSIYQARPSQCRTWPFWPDTLNAKTWNTEVKTFCPGVGKGRLYTKREIEEQAEKAQADDLELFGY